MKNVVIYTIIIALIALLIFMLSKTNTNQDAYTQTASITGVFGEVFDKSHLDADGFLNYIKEPEVVVLDIRTPEEFQSGHIDDAINIDYYSSEFKTQLENLDKDKAYAIYCRSGSRSSKALEIMRDLGFTNTKDLANGYASLPQNCKVCVR